MPYSCVCSRVGLWVCKCCACVCARVCVCASARVCVCKAIKQNNQLHFKQILFDGASSVWHTGITATDNSKRRWFDCNHPHTQHPAEQKCQTLVKGQRTSPMLPPYSVKIYSYLFLTLPHISGAGSRHVEWLSDTTFNHDCGLTC